MFIPLEEAENRKIIGTIVCSINVTRKMFRFRDTDCQTLEHF